MIDCCNTPSLIETWTDEAYKLRLSLRKMVDDNKR